MTVAHQPNSTRPWLHRNIAWAVAAALIAMGLALVYVVQPDGAWFYPRCLIHVLTGLDCPGCGATRALHRLLHGKLVEAWQFNPLFVTILLPCCLYWILRYAWQSWHGRRFGSRLLPNWAAWSLLVVVVGFGVIRNTPVYPFKTSALSRQQSSPAKHQPVSSPTLTHLP